MSSSEWLARARRFYSEKNWIGALSAARNALREDVRTLEAWRLACDTLLAQDRPHKARLAVKALQRLARQTGDHRELEYAEGRIAEIEVGLATAHRRRGETDLTHFASRGDLEQVRELLKAGIDPNERNSSNWTALHRVAMNGQPEVARLLCASGADLEALDDLFETPLITACRFGNRDIIPVFIELGANVNHVAKEKHTALWYAISSMKDIDVVRQLIAAGADPNEEYEYGDTPFLLAVWSQEPSVVNYLLPITRDFARINRHGVSALRFAASYNDADLIEKLIARGVDVDQRNSYGHTALMSAAESNCVEAARMLLSYGADATLRTDYDDSAISLAAGREHREVYELLSWADRTDSSK